MLLLLAALLCADAAPFIAEVPEETAGAPERADDSAGRTAEASVRAAASSRGEGRAEVSARASADGVALTIGASESASIKAPQRQEILFGIEAGPLRGEARVVPQLAGLLRIAAELGVHSGTWGLVLGGRASSLDATEMRAVGVRLEVEGQLAEELHAGASAAVWALQLDAPPSADPWTRYGMATLDWCQRWEAGVWAARDLGPVSLTPSLSVSQPPQEGAYEARGSLAVEVQLGPAKLRVDAGAARLWAMEQMWMVDVTAGVTMSLR
jgi:hypothetical protein